MDNLVQLGAMASKVPQGHKGRTEKMQPTGSTCAKDPPDHRATSGLLDCLDETALPGSVLLQPRDMLPPVDRPARLDQSGRQVQLEYPVLLNPVNLEALEHLASLDSVAGRGLMESREPVVLLVLLARTQRTALVRLTLEITFHRVK